MNNDTFCSGTLGDSLIIALKLYDRDISRVFHYCYDKKYYSIISEIYSLINVTIIPVEKNELKGNIIEGYLNDDEVYTPFPVFDLPCIDHLGLPREYIAVSLQSGVDLTKHPWRFLDKSDISNIPNNKPIVLLGTDNRRLDFDTSYTIIDLRNKTNILESFSVISKSSEFYAPQGLLGFFALSQKVKSTLWLKHSMELHGMAMRIDKIKEWGDYITYINLIR